MCDFPIIKHRHRFFQLIQWFQFYTRHFYGMALYLWFETRQPPSIHVSLYASSTPECVHIFICLFIHLYMGWFLQHNRLSHSISLRLSHSLSHSTRNVVSLPFSSVQETTTIIYTLRDTISLWLLCQWNSSCWCRRHRCNVSLIRYLFAVLSSLSPSLARTHSHLILPRFCHDSLLLFRAL